MDYEVELKFELPEAAQAAVRQRLTERGVVWNEALQQQDRYWGHPSRDFAETDEALRIRREGDRAYLTYKGPKIDPASKTRREIEIEFPPGGDAAERMSSVLAALAFVDFANVRKRRTPGLLTFQGREIHVSVDEVEGLGTYVELETTASEADLAPAQAAVAALAAELGLARGIRRSYLELLLDEAR